MRRPSAVLALALALPGCAGDAPAVEHDGPTPWTWAPDDGPVATPLDATQLGDAVDEAIAAVRTVRARSVQDAFEEALRNVDATCPERESNGTQTGVSGDCTTDDGWSWYGVGMVSRLRGRIVLGDIDAVHRVWDFSTGNLRAEGPDGERYDFLGYSWYRDWDDDDGDRAITVELWGEIAVTGVDEYAGSWMTEGWAAEMYVDLRVRSDGTEGTWTVGISRLDGLAWAFRFDDIAFSTACAAEPVGTVYVLDQAGAWYTITFDGDVTCDGCGQADAGEVCADFTPLTTWEADPWEG